MKEGDWAGGGARAEGGQGRRWGGNDDDDDHGVDDYDYDVVTDDFKAIRSISLIKMVLLIPILT